MSEPAHSGKCMLCLPPTGGREVALGWTLDCGSLKTPLRPVPRKRRAAVATVGATVGFQDGDP